MDRLKLLLMPAKHQPDLVYLRHVPLRKVHVFTFMQILCLALLWILKSTVAAIIFPVMVGHIHVQILSLCRSCEESGVVSIQAKNCRVSLVIS